MPLSELCQYMSHASIGCMSVSNRVLVFFIYANSEPQPNAKYSCAASVAIAR